MIQFTFHSICNLIVSFELYQKISKPFYRLEQKIFLDEMLGLPLNTKFQQIRYNLKQNKSQVRFKPNQYFSMKNIFKYLNGSENYFQFCINFFFTTTTINDTKDFEVTKSKTGNHRIWIPVVAWYWAYYTVVVFISERSSEVEDIFVSPHQEVFF